MSIYLENGYLDIEKILIKCRSHGLSAAEQQARATGPSNTRMSLIRALFL